MFSRLVKNHLRKRAYESPPVDSAETIAFHRRIVEANPILRDVYRRWYGEFRPAVEQTRHLGKPVIELGCGAGHVEQYIPEAIRTDRVFHPTVAQVVDAEVLPYADESVAVFLMCSVLHHLRRPLRCLAEVQRTLAPGGRLVLLEPTNSPMHKFVINRFHPYEYHDDTAPDLINEGAGRLSSANTAMGWMIFHRERAKFRELFPQLRIRGFRYHTFLDYYASGGMSFGPLIPPSLYPLVRLSERIAPIFRGLLCTMMTVDIEKLPTPAAVPVDARERIPAAANARVVAGAAAFSQVASES